MDRLRSNGVDTLYDVYDFSLGQDKNLFMEKVKSPEITHVLVFATKQYKDKADKRQGGVGVETQLLSEEVYQEIDQQKVIVLVLEKDQGGKPFIPQYMESRKYVDFTDDTLFDNKFEELLRHIFNQPKHTKPPLGNVPDFTNSFQPQLRQVPTSGCGKQEAFYDYHNILDCMSEFRRMSDQDISQEHVDEVILDKLKKSKPARDKLLLTISTELSAIKKTDQEAKLQFIENLVHVIEVFKSFTHAPAGSNHSNRVWYDHFRLMLKEIILHSATMLIMRGHFDLLYKLASRTYFFTPSFSESQSKHCSFARLCDYEQALDHRNSRLKMNRKSLSADMTKERTLHPLVSFRQLVETDSVLCILTQFIDIESTATMQNSIRNNWWYPYLRIYADEDEKHFFPLNQLISKQKALQIIQMFGCGDLEEFKQKVLKALDDPKAKRASEIRIYGWTICPNLKDIPVEDMGSLP